MPRLPTAADNMTSEMNTRGLGIATVGFLVGVLSAVLIATCSKIGDVVGLSYWMCAWPMLPGALGVVVGLITACAGVVITWLSVAEPGLDLSWMVTGLERLRAIKTFHMLGVVLAFAGLASASSPSAVVFAGTGLLVVLTVVYLLVVRRAYVFLARELRRIDGEARSN